MNSTTIQKGATRRWRVATAVIGGALALASTGCGVTSSESTSSKGADNASSQVKDRLSAAHEVPKLTSPGAKVDTSAAAGKSVLVIPLFSNNEYNQLIDQAMVETGKLTNTSVSVFDNQGQVNQWAAGVNQAISQKVDVLVLSGGIDPRLLLPQIAKARAAGIKVISSQFFDDAYKAASCGGKTTLDCAEGLDAVVPAPYSKVAQLDADWIINNSGGDAHTLVLTANDVGPNAHQVAAIKKEFAAECKGCKQTYVNIPSSQWATNTQSTVQSALNRDPSIDYVLPVYDVMATDTATAIGVSGKAGKVKVATFNGTPAVLALVQKGNTIGMDVAQNLAQIGYANMDQVYRLLAGVQPSSSSRDVIRTFDKDNVDDAGTPPKGNGGFGQGYLAEYKKLWGVG